MIMTRADAARTQAVSPALILERSSALPPADAPPNCVVAYPRTAPIASSAMILTTKKRVRLGAAASEVVGRATSIVAMCVHQPCTSLGSADCLLIDEQ